MLVHLLKSKIHRATITQANLNYGGSITIDETLMKAASLNEYEKVQVVNINNGHRFETYVIKGKADSGIICFNGASARLGVKNDLIIIMSFVQLDHSEVSKHKPIIVHVDQNNRHTKT